MRIDDHLYKPDRDRLYWNQAGEIPDGMVELFKRLEALEAEVQRLKEHLNED